MALESSERFAILRIVHIETDRLLIRSFRMDDVEAYHRLVNDERVTRFLGDGAPHDLRTASRYVEDCVSREVEGRLTRYAVVWKDGAQLIGFSGFKDISGLVDFGYRFSPDFWGCGVATEAGIAVLNHARRYFAPPAITARVVVGNAASVAVLRKLGFVDWDGPQNRDDCFEWFHLMI